MAKIEKKNPVLTLPISDWDMDIWDKEMYEKHTNDFRKIKEELDEIRKKCPSAVMARWYWLQKKGAVTLKMYLGVIDPCVKSQYKKFDNMFTKYCDWNSFQEKKMGIDVATEWKKIIENKNSNNDLETYYRNIIDFNDPFLFN